MNKTAAAPILVIDDDSAIRELVLAILQESGYLAIAARNGAEGLALAQAQRPALVLLDLQMPVMGGLAFAQAMRQHGVVLPIVLMTATPNPRQWANEVQAVGYLAKPFGVQALLACVARFYPPAPIQGGSAEFSPAA